MPLPALCSPVVASLMTCLTGSSLASRSPSTEKRTPISRSLAVYAETDDSPDWHCYAASHLAWPKSCFADACPAALHTAPAASAVMVPMLSSSTSPDGLSNAAFFLSSTADQLILAWHASLLSSGCHPTQLQSYYLC